MLIDGAMVNGTAAGVSRFGGLLRLVQTGYLYSYAFWMMIGLALLLGWFLMHFFHGWYGAGASRCTRCSPV